MKEYYRVYLFDTPEDQICFRFRKLAMYFPVQPQTAPDILGDVIRYANEHHQQKPNRPFHTRMIFSTTLVELTDEQVADLRANHQFYEPKED